MTPASSGQAATSGGGAHADPAFDDLGIDRRNRAPPAHDEDGDRDRAHGRHDQHHEAADAQQAKRGRPGIPWEAQGADSLVETVAAGAIRTRRPSRARGVASHRPGHDLAATPRAPRVTPGMTPLRPLAHPRATPRAPPGDPSRTSASLGADPPATPRAPPATPRAPPGDPSRNPWATPRAPRCDPSRTPGDSAHLAAIPRAPRCDPSRTSRHPGMTSLHDPPRTTRPSRMAGGRTVGPSPRVVPNRLLHESPRGLGAGAGVDVTRAQHVARRGGERLGTSDGDGHFPGSGRNDGEEGVDRARDGHDPVARDRVRRIPGPDLVASHEERPRAGTAPAASASGTTRGARSDRRDGRRRRRHRPRSRTWAPWAARTEAASPAADPRPPRPPGPGAAPRPGRRPPHGAGGRPSRGSLPWRAPRP